jgi:hypothetical protein
VCCDFDQGLADCASFEEMSRLELYARPLVAFDAANKEHRRWFAHFQAKRAWGQCPVRFIVPDDQGDLITLIQRRLIEYYTTKEFSKEF